MEFYVITNRIKKLSFSPTMAMMAKAKELTQQGVDIIDLSPGEPDFFTPDNIKLKGIEAINSNFTKYTVNAGIADLRNLISKKLLSENNLSYLPNNIIVSNGAKQSVFNSIMTIIENGDEVIIPAPYYVSYPDMVKIADGTPIYIYTDESTEFKVTPEILLKYITPKTKAFILCSPCNPTGSVYTKDELEDLAEIFVKHNIIVISDEVYEKLVFGNSKHISIASLNQKIKDLTITINGMSKTYCMTGWRIGYTAASDEIIKGINIFQSHATSAASSISQYASVEALKTSPVVIENMRIEFEKRRDYLCDELNSIKNISCFKSSGAFYLLPNIKSLIADNILGIKNSTDFAFYLLDKAHVSVVPGDGFGAEGYIRIAYATSMENLEKAVERIKKVLSL